MPICALISGGLDSGVLLHRLVNNQTRVVPLYVRCGLHWENAEVYWLRRFLGQIRCAWLAPLQTVELPMGSVYGTHWSLTGRGVPSATSPDAAVYLPGRNVLLVTAAAIRCARHRISTIALGLLAGNPFGDASSRCLDRLASSLSEALRHPIRVVTPLRRFQKAALIRSAATLPWELTWSCLRPQRGRHCGRCNKCAERRRAFREAGVVDPTRYAANGSGHFYFSPPLNRERKIEMSRMACRL
jgi:7-cyano-7-deazaguanine synthase